MWIRMVEDLRHYSSKNIFSQDHVEYIAGHAKFTGPKEVTVDGAKYTAEHILIATGTKPIIPLHTR